MNAFGVFFVVAMAVLGALAGQATAQKRPVVKPEVKLWEMPSCPRELTLQDGTRWAKPDWSEPKCRATIGWEVVR